MAKKNTYKEMWERLQKFVDAAIYYFDQYPSYSCDKQNDVIKEIIAKLGIEDGVDMLLGLYQTNRSYRSLQIGKSVMDKMKRLENEFLGTNHETRDPLEDD